MYRVGYPPYRADTQIPVHSVILLEMNATRVTVDDPKHQTPCSGNVYRLGSFTVAPERMNGTNPQFLPRWPILRYSPNSSRSTRNRSSCH